jgi:hypothetical protein
MTSSVKALFCVAVFGVLACGGDNGTGPNDETGVTFPAIDPALAALVCIRGQAVPPTSKTGTITDDDCHTTIVDDGYWETWRVRVPSATSVTFTVDSGFDSWLELARVGDVNDPVNTLTFLAQDDDSGPGLDAMLTHSLQANTEYIISVSGYDDSETGSYTLHMDT